MSRSFRLAPPESPDELLTRPRLLRSLTGRWSHRVTSLSGGPGLGKTTLLSQAIAENRLAPRGEDVWVGLDRQDAAADRLALAVVTALAGPGAGDAARSPYGKTIEPAEVAETVWQRAPTDACLVLDDVHLLPAESSGAAWLTELVDELPDNGHLVLASRSRPPVPLTRLGSQGAVLHLGEEDLRFSDDELSAFAARRGVDPGQLDQTGGWPAMAALSASVDQRLTGDYLWEEILRPLGGIRRHVLAVLCDLGGADDALMSAALGSPVELTTLLADIPLVASDRAGWHRPHALWRTAPGLELVTDERVDIRRRAVEHLSGRGRFDDAFNLVEEAELWASAPGVLRDASLASDSLDPGQLGQWLVAIPPKVRTSPSARLASGVHASLAAPDTADDQLWQAVTALRDAGDVDGELSAIAQLGRLAWFRQDLDTMARLAPRVSELEATGHPAARSLAAIARAVFADLAGDDEAVLQALAQVEPTALDQAWSALTSFLTAQVRIDRGEMRAAEETLARWIPTAEPALQAVLNASMLVVWWTEGHVDRVLKRLASVVDDLRANASAYNLHLGLSAAGYASAWTGEVAPARRYLNEASRVASTTDSFMAIQFETARALIQLAEGDEEAAAATLRQAMSSTDLDQGATRRPWRRLLAVSYVLLPETRAGWNAADIRGHVAVAHRLARALVALREGGGHRELRELDLPEIGVVRACLPYRLATELAVGLAAIDRPEGALLLDALGPPGRAAARDLTAADRPSSEPAKALLAAVPAPPPRANYLAVLGPLALYRDGPGGDEVVDPELRRQRLHELIAYLVAHRRTTRTAVTAALWPDLDERSAHNNLGVTLNHLLRLLEPARSSREPPYLVRPDGLQLRLVVGDYLRIDSDEFDDHLAAAAQGETDGLPSVALEHNLVAVELYRGDLHLDLPDADWLTLDRERYRTRFVAAAVRAGQLLLSHGDPEHADAVAYRALEVDPWAEEAYAVLISGALARRDRSAARRLLTRCVEVLADLGVDPSDSIHQLELRLQG